MRKPFDWERFKHEKIVVHYRTEEESKDFIERCCEKRITLGNISLLSWDYWRETTCYCVFCGTLRYNSTGYFKTRNYIILEWSDYMEKEREFTINDLRSGYLVEIADNRKCLVVEDYFGLSLCDTENLFRIITKKDTKLKDSSQSNNRYSILKVYGHQTFSNQDTIYGRELLWEYKEPKKELTIEEIEKELGYKIKIVGDK